MMNNKVLVEIIVPAAEKKFDVLIPAAGTVNEIKTIIASVISDLSEGKFIADTKSVLYCAEDGHIFDINKMIYETGIKSGSKLLFS